MRTIPNFDTPPSTALRDLAHKPVAFVLISVLAFCCRVSHTTTVSAMRKVWLQSSFCVFWCRSSFSCCYSGLVDPIIVVQASFRRSFCVASTDYQRFLASLKLMTSQVVQSARPLSGRRWPLWPQRVKRAAN